MSRPRGLDLVLPAAVVLASFYSLYFYAASPSRLPTEADYTAMEARLRGEFREGDLLDIHPFWAVHPRQFVGDLPNRNFKDVAAADLHRYSRLWVASVFGKDAELDRKLASRYAPLSQSDFGRIRLYLYDLPDVKKPLYDFLERIRDAKVWVEKGKESKRKDCSTWEDGRWVCSPTPDWHFVGRELKDFGGDAEECIWAHPVADGRIRIEFPAVPLGSKLVGGSGITTWGFRYHQKGAPVDIEVAVAGKPIAQVRTENKLGFFPFEVDTSAFSGSTLPVTFTVSAKPNWGRHFCFRAEAVE